MVRGKKPLISHCDFLAGAALSVLLFVTAAARAQSTIIRASLAPDGTTPVGLPPSPEDFGSRYALSRDGTRAVFLTRTALVAEDANDTTDVYMRDLPDGPTVLVSIGSAGAAANSLCAAPAISGNGRYVAFVSAATNLTAEATGGFDQVFVRDTLGGTTEPTRP